MRCTSPRTVGFQPDGKTLCWSQKHYSKEYGTFQIPCGKCLACRLENSRQTAIRCVHEAMMHQDSIFLTLTYSDKNLKSPKLQYKDIQLFIKKLRNHIHNQLLERLFPNVNQNHQRKLFRSLPKESRDNHLRQSRISILTAGEYGDKTKRPHWHLIIFNYRPSDSIYYRKTDTGDYIYTSSTIDTLWGQNDPSTKPNEIGDVTFKSASYVARYATKKLIHGKDGTHDFEPISRRSAKNAIGKSWLEKYYKDAFNTGFIVLNDGAKCGIPRYYEKWLQKNHPQDYVTYITTVKNKIIEEAIEKEKKITLEEKKINMRRSGLKGIQRTQNEARRKTLEIKHQESQKYLKL